VQLAGERRAGNKTVADRHHGDAAGGQRGEPPRAVVGLVAAAPPATVDVDDDRRVVLRWPVDVQREVRPIMRRKYQILLDLHIHKRQLD
jgi:hypothetical protein